MNESLEEAIQTARKMEMDGIEFYGKAAENAGNPDAERFFQSLQSDEERHLDIVEKIGRGMGVDIDNMPTPEQGIRTVFSEVDPSVAADQEATAEEKEAVEIALGMEKDSYDLYDEAAVNAEDEDQRALFERLAKEENQHYVMLENTLEYLQENSNWTLWKESGLLTGDMSSLGG